MKTQRPQRSGVPMNARLRADGGALRRGAGRRAGLLAAAGSALALAAVAACSSGGGGGSASGTQNGFKPAAQTGGTLTVWVDSTRLAAAQLYQKQNPKVKMKIVTYDGDANGSNYLQTKVSLFNRTRGGWPDVVFSAENNEVTWAVPAGFAAPLNKGLIAQATLDGWASGANAPCTVDG